jgi:hypothetical protein
MAQEADHTLVEIVRNWEDSRLDLPEECGHMLIIKWQSTTQQGIQHNPTGPDVHLRPSIQLA